MASTANQQSKEQQRLALQEELIAANINPASCLATDYLNHYNEIAMMLEMLADMPDMIDEALEWRPKSYQDHFRDSGFAGKELAIRGYNLAPDDIRAAFEAVCDRLDTMILQILNGLMAVGAADRGLSDQAQGFVRSRVAAVQHDLMVLNQVIHGKCTDAMMVELALSDEPKEEEQAAQTQEDIDKLFD